MAWNLVLLETFCMCSVENGDVPPDYCLFGPERPDAHCMVGTQESTIPVPCRYASWSKARNTAAFTEEEGRVVAFDAFSVDSNASDAENERSEQAWQRTLASKIMKQA